jgi:hypothetical protein
LVGNFGDGCINVFAHGRFAGRPRDTNNRKITIDGHRSCVAGSHSRKRACSASLYSSCRALVMPE